MKYSAALTMTVHIVKAIHNTGKCLDTVSSAKSTIKNFIGKQTKCSTEKKMGEMLSMVVLGLSHYGNILFLLCLL